MDQNHKAWVDLSKDDINKLLISLVGYTFGEKPEERVEEIRQSRRRYARVFADYAGLSAQDTILDLGSGCGFGTELFSEISRKVLACDISPAYLSYASGIVNDDNVEFLLIENDKLSAVAGNTVDKILSMSVFIHLNLYDIYQYFSEFKRILKPDGKVVLDFADMDSLFLGEKDDNDFFLNAFASYRSNKYNLFALMQWNSAKGICNIANRVGFSLERREKDILVFVNG